MLPPLLFIYGFLAACAGLLLQTLPLLFGSDGSSAVTPGLGFILAAAFFEEFAKFAFLFQAFRRYELPALTIPSLLSFGLGFASVELLLLIGLDTLPAHQIFPVFLNILLHLGTTLALGLGLRHFTVRHGLPFLLLGGVTIAHSLYNLFRLESF